MSWREILKVALLLAQKELRELTRDMRTLVMLVGIPALLYPLLVLGAARLGSSSLQALDEKPLTIVVDDDVPIDVVEAVKALKGIERIGTAPHQSSDDNGEPRAVAAHVSVAPPSHAGAQADVVVEVSRATEAGLSAERRLLPVLRQARTEARDERLRAMGVDDFALRVPRVDIIDVAKHGERGNFLLGRMMVPLLLVILVMGAFYPAIDATAGERERKTLRTLLCAPVPAMGIALGKLFAVSAVALLAAGANVIGFAATVKLGLGALGEVDLPLSALLVTVALLVPMALYVSAVLMAVAATASTSREAQTYLTPLVLVLMLPAVGAAIPGVDASLGRALIPVFGPALVLREAYAGTLSAPLFLSGLAGALAVVVAALGIASRAFTVEALLTGRVSRPQRAPGPLPTFDAVLLLFTLVASFIYAGVPLQGWHPPWGIALSLGITFVGIPLLFASVRSSAPLQTLGLVRPKTGAWVFLGLLLLSPAVAALSEKIARTLFVLDGSMMEALKKMAEGFAGVPEGLLFFVFAVVPAIAEEIAFRGALQRAFSKRNAAVGIIVTATLFAAFHGALIRAPTTFAVGILAGVAAYRTGSTFAAMGIHFAHNATALMVGTLVAKEAGQSPGMLSTSSAPVFSVLPWWVYGFSAFGCVLIALGWKGARKEETTPTGSHDC